MARIRPGTTALNAGEFGAVMAARVDFEKYPLAAKTLINWLPLVQGGIVRRQGFRILETLSEEHAMHAFESNRDNGYLVHGSATAFKFWYDDEKVVTQSQITITNGTFTGGAPPTGWTDNSTGSATVTGGGSGAVFSVPVASTDEAIIEQTLTSVANTTYSIFVDVEKGPVTIKFGSASGGSDLGGGSVHAGYHTFEVTATGTSIFVELSSTSKFDVTITEIGSNATGSDLEVTHGLTLAQMKAFQYTQSIDVQFLTTPGYQLSSLSRRGVDAFGWMEERLINGPYSDYNTTSITMSASGISGSVTVTASSAFFDSGHIGRVLYLEHTGQFESASITSENTFTDEILIDGSGTFRRITVNASGVSPNTVTLQRSFDSPGTWVDVESYTADTSKVFDDSLDNQVVYYRIGIKTGDYTSGTVTASLRNSSSISVGEGVITAVASSTSATVEVINAFGFSASATEVWRLSRYGGSQGYPTSIQLHEGRLWMGGAQFVDGSVSDDFTNFDSSTTDDDRAISRIIDSRVSWMESIGELVVGGQNQEYYAQSQLNKVYTPSDFRLKKFTSEGSKALQAVVSGIAGLFVHRDGSRLFEIAVTDETTDIGTTSMARLNPEIGAGGIKKIQLQKSPEIRIWCLKESGQLIVLTYLRQENVVGWSRIDIDGKVNDFAIVEGKGYDRIYAELERSNGARYLCIYDNEQWDVPAQSNNLDFSFTPIEPTAGTTRITLSGGDFSRDSGYSGSITLTADSAVFASGDVGKKVFLKDGQGLITSFSSSTSVVVNFTIPIEDLNPVPSGDWYMGTMQTAVTGLVASETYYGWADGIEIGPVTADGSGNLTLVNSAAWVHLGKRPKAVFEGLKLHQGAQGGIGIGGVSKKVNEVGFVLHRTAPVLEVGALSSNSADLDELDIEEISVRSDVSETSSYGGLLAAGAVFTGEARQRVDGLTEFDPRIQIVAEKTGPACILSYAPGHSINER